MNYVEYGKGNSNVIILIHGGGFSWWNYKEIAEMLQTNYHIIIHILFHAVKNKYNNDSEKLNDRYSKK